MTIDKVWNIGKSRIVLEVNRDYGRGIQYFFIGFFKGTKKIFQFGLLRDKVSGFLLNK